jgi:hypothetical protein
MFTPCDYKYSWNILATLHCQEVPPSEALDHSSTVTLMAPRHIQVYYGRLTALAEQLYRLGHCRLGQQMSVGQRVGQAVGN